MIKKRMSVVLLFIMLLTFCAAGWSLPVSAAVTGSEAVKSSEVIQVASDSNSDIKYAFEIKQNANTKVVPLSSNPSGSSVELEDNFWAFKAPSDSYSGNFGAWIYNVGTYNGNVIDIKCTFYWYDKIIDGVDCIPLITLKVADYISIGYYNRNIMVKYEVYSNNKPFKINIPMKFEDVDGYQFFGVKLNNGSMHQVQCTSDCALLYGHGDGWYFMDSKEPVSNPTDKTAMRFEIDETNSFTVMYGVPYDVTYYSIYNSYSYLNNMNKESTVKGTTLNMNTWFDNALKGIVTDGINELKSRPAIAYFRSKSFGRPPELQPPVKTITDVDEINVTENTLQSVKEHVTYRIIQMVPYCGSGYFKSFEIEDTLPKGFEYKNGSARVTIGGQDVTGRFDITNSDGVLTAAAKSSALIEASFYGYEYILEFEGELVSNDSVTTTKNVALFSNQAITKSQLSTETELTENKSNIVTSVYEWKYRDFQVKKVWDDGNDADGLRPDSVDVVLKREKYVADSTIPSLTEEIGTVTLSEDNNWSGSLNGIKDYDEDFVTYKYVWVEKDMPYGYTTSSETKGSLTEILNRHITETRDVNVELVWDDDNNRDGIRPESVEIALKADGEEIQTIVIKKGDSHTVSIKNLPKNKEGTPIAYTFTQKDIFDGYRVTYDVEEEKTVITDIHIPEKVTVSVEKIWKDNNNFTNARPESIIVTLYINGEKSDRTLELSDENDWNASIKELYKYENGKQITYYFSEEDVPSMYVKETKVKGLNTVIVNTLEVAAKPKQQEERTMLTTNRSQKTSMTSPKTGYNFYYFIVPLSLIMFTSFVMGVWAFIKMRKMSR